MTDQVTVLTHPTALLTKRWYIEKGKAKQQDYGFAKTFEAQVIDVDSFDELCELLDVLATEPKRCIIRGQPIPGRDLSNVLRRKNAKSGEPAYFKEVPRRWLMLDVDLKDTEVKTDYHTPEGCRKVVIDTLAQLPFECRTAAVWWQLSSSAGFKPGLRCHLWFWLDRPLGENELGRWAELANERVGKIIVDDAVFRTVQPNYTANPIFEGVVDPVAVRTGRIDGPDLALPRLFAKTDQWRKKLDPLRSANNTEVHRHVRDACASFFCSNGPDTKDDVLRTALRSAVDYSLDIREVEETKYTDEHLQSYIDGGREFARSRAAAGENLLLNSDGTPKSTVGNIYAIISSSEAWNGLVAWNRRYDRVDFLREPPWGGGSDRPWVDADSVKAAAWFVKEHRMGAEDGPVYKAVQAFSKDFSFDPVEDWLVSLQWDGKKRLDTWLLDWCGCEDKPYNRKVSRIWPISAVARALNRDPLGVQVDTVLVLQGATGIGKTRLFRTLGGNYYAAVIEEKDLIQKIHGPWITEFPELGPFNHKEVNKIKGFVDQKVDRIRIPYGRIPEDKTRSSVLVSTTNEHGWQEDATSARRFWPVNTVEVKLELVEAEQLWAEAVLAYKAGEEWWVAATDPDFIREQEAQYAYDPWQDSIIWCLTHGKNAWGLMGEPITIRPGTTAVSARELFVVVFSNNQQNKQDQMRLGKCMRKLGWKAEGGGWTGEPFMKTKTTAATVDKSQYPS